MTKSGMNECSRITLPPVRPEIPVRIKNYTAALARLSK